MTRKLTGLLATICLLLPALAPAQSVRLYDAEQLSSNLVTSICQDDLGYLWIGTEYGLNKFDGVYFTQYYSDDTQPGVLADDIVRQVFPGRDGDVWVVTNLGVQRYDRLSDRFEPVRFGDGLTANVNDILQTPEGKIWILHARRGVLEVDGMEARALERVNRAVTFEGEKNNMYLDGRGRLWIGFREKGLQMVDSGSGEARFYGDGPFADSRALDVVEDSRGRLTVATYTSLEQFNEQTQAFETVVSFPRNDIHRLYPGDGGRILIATSGSGLWLADPDAHAVQPVWYETDGQVDLLSAKVNAVQRDRDGNLWLVCYQKGLVGIDGKESTFHFLPLRRMQGDNGNVLRAVFADSRGRTYICQEKGGVTSIDREGRTLGHWMGDHTVMTLYEDPQGLLWAGTYRNGLFCVDPETGRESWMPLTGTARIGGITRDREGNLYAAVFGVGLRSFSPDGRQERRLGGGTLALTNPYLNTLFTDDRNLIWIGHYYGIDVYDPAADRLVDVAVPDALRPAVVYQIRQSPLDRSVWVGSNKGLFRYHADGEEPGRWERYTTRDGLPNNIICGMAFTPDGTLWAGTYRGLAEMAADGHITRYYRGDGLEEWSYLRGVSACSAQGEVILGNQNGITFFVPGTQDRNRFEAGITLTAMRLGDSSVNAASRSGGRTIISGPLETAREIAVSYQDNTFSLRFSPMDFRDPQSLHYEFRFTDEPRDQWYQTETGRSEIFFSHLSPGRHGLVVRAYDNGVYSPEKLISIRVSPPWYRTWGAYVLYLILALAIATLWWRNYWNRRQAEANEEKIKFFVDISHELRSPLTLIKGPLNQLLATSQDPRTTRALRNMERNTNRLLTLTNQILSIRKIEKGQMQLHFARTGLSAFVEDICHDYDYQAANRQILLSFVDEAPDLEVWLDRDHFDKVVTNLINNAFKFTPDGGEIEVRVRAAGPGQAELVVRDTGPGIDEGQLQKIFERFYQTSARPAAGQMSYGIGLNLTQKIVALHRGGISARNRTDGQGAEFVVRLQTGSAHLREDQLVEDDYFSDATGTRPVLPVTDADLPRRPRAKTAYRIAVADDDEEIRSFLETELGETYRVSSYPDGQKALEGIVEQVPDLVISDVVMPVMDGFELLRRIKASTATSHVPVILLTTRVEHQAHITGLEGGADAYVDKPFNLEELETLIASLIANRIRMRGKFTGLQEQEETVRKVGLKGNDAALMERIMRNVNERLDDSNFNVEALADAVGLSRVQLHRRVKEITGITVGEFIRNLRLQQAARLLEGGDNTISQVAYSVGFSNPTHFSAAFKKHFGVTPSEYLAKHKK